MSINLKSTRTAGTSGVKILVYGQAGSGKTSLIATLPSPVILSAESGLLPLARLDIPVVEIESVATLHEAYRWLATSEEGSAFRTVCLDSISEIGEVVLGHEMTKTKDPRQAYGEMQTQMASLIRGFRDLRDRNVYFSAKVERQKDEMERLYYYPSLPGNKAAQGLPYFFDEVLALRMERDSEGAVQRALMTESDGTWIAKDRSGKLGKWEAPDLGSIIRKIEGASDE